MDRPLAPLPPFDPFRRRPNGRPLVSGHRGALREAPENTMASFARAHELGADLIEFDVQATADVLDWMRGRVYPILEIKQRPGDERPSLVEPIAAALEAAGMVDQTLAL